MKHILKTKQNTTILSIETSCDETSLAIVHCQGALRTPRFTVAKNLVSSQIAIHQPFGGVVPNLAKREHLKNLPLLFEDILKKYPMKKVDVIAVTVGPGLEPALWTGIEFAKKISTEYQKPLVGVNHMEGHLYSGLLSKKSGVKIQFPAVALIVSGGHTILLHLKNLHQWTNLGETLDDAAGEAFDKVAKMMKLPYPGGPVIQKLAEQGNKKAIAFPRPMLKTNDYTFSFSGLKTSVLYYLRDNPQAQPADVAASFQEAVIEVLSKKTEKAVKEYKAKTIILCGGVSANQPLRERLHGIAKNLKIKCIVPDFEFNTDNAAMIAAAGYMNFLQKKNLPMEANGSLSI